MVNEAHIKWAQSQEAEAVSLMGTAVNLSIKVLGDGHPDTVVRGDQLEAWTVHCS
jgi:hypothetical protein